MKNLIRNATLKKAIWRVTNVVVALCLLLSINAMAQLDSKKTSGPVVIDGNFTDCGWANANFVTFTNAVAGVPTVTTTAVTNPTNTTATSGGNVTYDGGYSVTARGVCWATTANPTTASSKTTNGTGTGTFTSSLTGLTAGTTYYVRAYATNSAGTGYGTQVSFTTTGGGGGGCGQPNHVPCPTNSYVANVTSFGAVGNAVLTGGGLNSYTNPDGTQYSYWNGGTWSGTDNTAAIQAAVNDVCNNHPGGTVLVPAGTYLVSIVGNSPPYPVITLGSNMTFKMEPGAVIKLKANNSGAYGVLYLPWVSNVNIVGGTLQGERHQHTLPGDFTMDDMNGQWGMGVFIKGSSNIYVEDVLAREMWGDGFYIDTRSNNINFYSVVAEDNRRQGMSIVDGDYVTIKNSIFKYTRGAPPQSGLDIEPQAAETVNHVIIDNTQFLNNWGSGLELALNMGAVSNLLNYVVVTNCTITGNRWGLVWRNPGTGSSYSGCTINSNSICNLYGPGEICQW